MLLLGTPETVRTPEAEGGTSRSRCSALQFAGGRGEPLPPVGSWSPADRRAAHRRHERRPGLIATLLAGGQRDRLGRGKAWRAKGFAVEKQHRSGGDGSWTKCQPPKDDRAAPNGDRWTGAHGCALRLQEAIGVTLASSAETAATAPGGLELSRKPRACGRYVGPPPTQQRQMTGIREVRAQADGLSSPSLDSLRT